MSDTRLFLGDFEFQAYEIPESIPFGGSQRLVTHQFPGGSRSVQAMGRDDAAITWTGLFFGQTALDRARYLDTQRSAGKSLSLIYLDFNYTVVIERFEATLKKFNNIRYSISLQVVQDNTQPVNTIEPTGFDAAIRGDMDTCNSLGDSIGDGPLSGLLGVLDSAIATVSDFATATSSVIASVIGPLGAVINRVNLLKGVSGSALTSVSTLGGIIPGNPIAVQAQKMFSQVNAATQYPQLINLGNVANRMVGNISGIGSTSQTKSITLAGGNLFDVAKSAYGDATKWFSIAQANGIIDPQLTGVNTLNIPVSPPDTGGAPST